MRLHVVKVDLFLTNCSTRIPFRFGMSTLTFAPLCTARVSIETEGGQRIDGFSADLLVPKWFEKNPGKSAQDDVQALIESARYAGRLLTDPNRSAKTVFDHWWDMYIDRIASQSADAPDLLVHGFGVSLLERAMMDAVCRAAEMSFFDSLKSDLFGFEPSRAHTELCNWDLSRSLSNRPAKSIHLRHTIGLLDSLRESDIADSDRVNDGFPESLEADILRYGLTYFKIKLSGNHKEDINRLVHIADALDSVMKKPAHFTLDGNEQYHDLNDLADLLEEFQSTDLGTRLLERLLYIEQPLSRSHTFDVAPNRDLARVERFAPLLIDEADADLSAFPRAIKLGYRGVSVKNCKGVFRALINRGLCDLSDCKLFQAAEDLTNLPILALQQDLTTVAALGLAHVERNGHHFFRGLDHLPKSEIKRALIAHPDLYIENEGATALRIEDGCAQLDSLQQVGFGYNVEVCTDERVPVDTWSWPE